MSGTAGERNWVAGDEMAVEAWEGEVVGDAIRPQRSNDDHGDSIKRVIMIENYEPRNG